MTHEANLEQRVEAPFWETELARFVSATESPAFTPEAAVDNMLQLCYYLRRGRLVEDFGQVQQYLARTNSSYQLVALPFRTEPDPSRRCIDPSTDEPKACMLWVAKNAKEYMDLLEMMRTTAKENVELLRTSTGIADPRQY